MGMVGLYFREAQEQGLPIGEGLALQGGPSALLGKPGAGGEIGIGLLFSNLGEGALHAHLLQKPGPPEAHGGVGVVGQLHGLCGEAIAKKHKACFCKTF